MDHQGVSKTYNNNNYRSLSANGTLVSFLLHVDVDQLLLTASLSDDLHLSDSARQNCDNGHSMWQDSACDNDDDNSKKRSDTFTYQLWLLHCLLLKQKRKHFYQLWKLFRYSNHNKNQLTLMDAKKRNRKSLPSCRRQTQSHDFTQVLLNLKVFPFSLTFPFACGCASEWGVSPEGK